MVAYERWLQPEVQLYFEGKRKQNIGKFKNKSWMSPKDSEFISNNPLHSLSTLPDTRILQWNCDSSQFCHQNLTISTIEVAEIV